MKFWAIWDDYCEYEFKEPSHREQCEACKISPIDGICKKGFLNITKSKDKTSLRFCFEPNTPRKQAKYVADICSDGYTRQSVMLADIRRRNLQYSEVANHNIVNLVAGMGLKLNELLPTTPVGADEKSRYVRNIVSDKKDLVTRHIISFDKAICQIESERLIIALMERSIKPSKIDLTKHPIHGVVLISKYICEDALLENRISVRIGSCYSDVSIEFNAALSAISQIFSNAAKYCKPDSYVDVGFRDEQEFMCVDFSMNSLYFNQSEISDIKMLGKRGANSTGIPGKGIGLYAVVEMMKICFGSLDIISGTSSYGYNGKNYSNNKFTLKFRKSTTNL